MDKRSPLVEFILGHQYVLTQVGFSKEIFMLPERMVANKRLSTSELTFEIVSKSKLYIGKLFVFENRFYSIMHWDRVDDRSSEYYTYHVTAEDTLIPYDVNETEPLAKPTDAFMLQPHEIINYKGNELIDTTIGILMANYLFLVYPFGDHIPYLNEEFTTQKLESMIVEPLLQGEIDAHTVKDKYVNTLALFGQSNEIFCPNISEKTLVVPDHIRKLLDRLVEENKEALEAGDSSVMSDIENQMIKAYKEHLKGDSSMDFLLKGKYFNVTLKKLLLTHGMVEVFGQPGKFTWVTQPLGSGWKQKDFPVICDEVRAGSYARAVETQFGGVVAKMILRVFQDTRIYMPDCGATKGEVVIGTPNLLRELVNTYRILPDKTTVVIEKKDIPSLVGKTIEVRTPGYCKAELGYCSKCFGRIYEAHGQTAFGPLANDLGKVFTTSALKQMHGKSHSLADVSDINKYLV